MRYCLFVQYSSNPGNIWDIDHADRTALARQHEQIHTDHADQSALKDLDHKLDIAVIQR